MRKTWFIFCAFLISAFCIGSASNASKSENNCVKTRTIELENSDYSSYEEKLKSFNDVNINYVDNTALLSASKPVDKSILSFLDNVSFEDNKDDDFDIKYNISFDVENDFLSISCEMCNDLGELYIDDLCGPTFINANNEIDAYFDCDGETITLSQLRECGMIQECGFLKNLVKSVVKVVVTTTVAVATVVNALTEGAELSVGLVCVTAVAAVATGVYTAIGSTAQTVHANINYVNNKKEAELNTNLNQGYITKQSDYGNWKFGVAPMSKVGCEVISAYNLMLSLGRKQNLYDVIYDFEMYNIDYDIGFGALGSCPEEMHRYFIKRLLDYKTYGSLSVLKNQVSKLKTCKIIFSTDLEKDTLGIHWIHTFFIEKRNGMYYSYNGPIDSGSKSLDGAVDYRFRVAYIVENKY